MRVANRHKDPSTPNDVYVGRGTVFGNRYSHKPYPGVIVVPTREIAVAYYEDWINQRLAEGDEALDNAFRALREDSVLVCSCLPMLCHASVVQAVWERWYR